MTIAERLAAQDPANAEWQRDLSVSCLRLAEALGSADQAEAGRWRQRGLAVLRRLRDEGRLDADALRFLEAQEAA